MQRAILQDDDQRDAAGVCLGQSASRLTLGELAAHIQDVLADGFRHRSFWVVADVIDCKPADAKGHHYFCLAEKDAATHTVRAKLTAVAWRRDGGQAIAAFEAATGQAFRSGIHVLVNVSVQFHPAHGLKLILNDVDPAFTIGRLEQERRATLDRLVALCPDYIRRVGDGYHTRNKGLTHARVIQRIAVLTSSQAAGYKDFQDCLDTNRHGYRLVVDPWFTVVQGEANAQTLCDRLIAIYQSGIPYDAVVIIRGGGSQSDLLLFEQFVLARAVAKFPIPIITGIGHQINESIVDLMAHTAVKTPTAAAETILAHNRAFEEALLGMQQRIVIRSQQTLAGHREALAACQTAAIGTGLQALAAAKDELNHCYGSVVRASRDLLYRHRSTLHEATGRLALRPRIATAAKRCELDGLTASLKGATRRFFLQKAGVLTHQAALTAALNPLNILKRGFAVLYHGAEIVTDASTLRPADAISIRLYETKLGATITTKTDLDGTIVNL